MLSSRSIRHASLPTVGGKIKHWLLRCNALLAALAFIVTGAEAAEDGASGLLQQFLDGLHTFQAEFEQVVLDENGLPVEEAKGTLVLARPGRFRWDYREPYPQLIVADGKYVWVYDPELAQVTVKELDKTVGDTPTLLLTGNDNLEDRFVIHDLRSQDGLSWVSLTPKSSDVSFTEIRLGLHSEELKRMELVDSFGQTTQLWFHQIAKNREVNPTLFSFTPPPGVDVVGDTPAGSYR